MYLQVIACLDLPQGSTGCGVILNMYIKDTEAESPGTNGPGARFDQFS